MLNNLISNEKSYINGFSSFCLAWWGRLSQWSLKCFGDGGTRNELLFSASFLPTEHARTEKSRVIRAGQKCSNPFRNWVFAVMHEKLKKKKNRIPGSKYKFFCNSKPAWRIIKDTSETSKRNRKLLRQESVIELERWAASLCSIRGNSARKALTGASSHLSESVPQKTPCFR